jgi:hypothetical protein
MIGPKKELWYNKIKLGLLLYQRMNQQKLQILSKNYLILKQKLYQIF